MRLYEGHLMDGHALEAQDSQRQLASLLQHLRGLLLLLLLLLYSGFLKRFSEKFYI
jgi:hypothetical protein